MNFEKGMFNPPIPQEKKEKQPEIQWEQFKEIDTIEAPVDAMAAAAFSPDGRYVAGTDGKTAYLFNSQNGKEVSKFESKTGVDSMALRKDGIFAFADRDGNLKMFAEGREYRSWSPNTEITALAISSDGKVVFTGKDQAIRVYDPGLREAQPLMSSLFEASVLAVAPDGAIAYGNGEGRLEICDAKSLRCSYDLDFKSKVASLSFAPEGKLLVGLENGVVKVLDSKTGKEIKTLEGHTAEVMSVSWTADNRVKSAGKDGTIRTWGTK